LSGWPTLDLVKILIFLSEQNIIANIRTRTTCAIKVIGNCLNFPRKKLRSFGLLELEIWAEHWTVSGLQDRFGLLCCCYNLDLKTTFLNLGLHMKVVGLYLTESVQNLEVIWTFITRDMTQLPNSVPVWTTPTSLF
jgi:hypothetical protein